MPREPQLTETVEPGDTDPGAAEITPGEILAGRYEIGEILGRGGLAVVYRAHDRELKRDVALKALRADRFSAASLLRLRREVKVARDVTSDRLVRIFDITTSESSVFLTMEVVEGGSLDRRLSEGPLPVGEAVRIASQVLEGLSVLHQRAIVHRDVKPGNVFLTSDGDVKLGDFGLALPLTTDETRATRHDVVVGTLQYLSPEQVLGHEVDARSDLYSLGVVLFEMLTGRHPYEGRSALGVMLGHLRETPNVRAASPEVPRWLAAVVQRLLARRPEDRYPSAEAVRMALESKAIPRSWLTRAAIAALLLIAAGGAAMVWLKPESSFSHLSYSEEGATAMSKDGRPLWTAKQVHSVNAIAAQLASGEPLRVVAILDAYRRPQTATILSILDADTGRELEKVELPTAAQQFEGFSDTFRPRLHAVDLDADGGDEILAVYTHGPWWPSFTYLYEPRIDRARLVFLGSGHHHFSGAHDLDGDGKSELVFAGINNRMGWYTGIAAVHLVPPVNQTSPWIGPAACTPDHDYIGTAPALLSWYSLGPRDHRYQIAASIFEPGRKRIRFSYPDAPFILGFDGFPSGLQTAVKDRASFRNQTYTHLREAERLLEVDFPEDALLEVRAARETAARAADPRLMDWVARVHARSLVAVHRFDEAHAAYEVLMQSSPAATDAAFEAGKALHLAGRLAEAVGWYQRGFGRGGAHGEGRGRSEILEGLVLALSELGRYQQALSEIDRFVAGYGLESQMRILRRFVRWQEGTFAKGEEVPGDRAEDLHRYWALELELELENGLDSRLLLSEVDQALMLSSEADPMLLSLKARLLARIGRNPQAAQVAEEGYELARQQRRELTGVCAHFRLIAQRAAAFSRAVGNESRAREIEAELAEWLEKRG